MSLPGSVLEWVTLLGLVGGWVWALSKVLDRNRRVAAKASHDKLLAEINGVGTRVNSLELSSGQHEVMIDKIERELILSASDRRQLIKEVANLTSSIEKLSEVAARHHANLTKEVSDLKVAITRVETEVRLTINQEKL